MRDNRRSTTNMLLRGNCGQQGFTLVEMLVVPAIIALIIGLVGPRVLASLANAKVKTAQIQIESLSKALEVYYLDNGHYPSSDEGLSALVAKPTNAQNWSGPYLKGPTDAFEPGGAHTNVGSPARRRHTT
jgi:general secretion pathway protein G